MSTISPDNFKRPCGLCNMLGHDCQACARRKGEVQKILDDSRDLVEQPKLFTFEG